MEVKMDLRGVNFEKLQSLTPDEMIIASILARAAKEAEEAKKVVYTSFTFRIGENEKEVWRNGHDNYERITHDGKWVGHYNGNGEYIINCQNDSNDIYSFFYAQIVYEEGYVEANDIAMGEITYAEARAIAMYFRAFLDRTKKQQMSKESRTVE